MIGNHLVVAATIMAIEQNDFRDLSICNLPGTAQTHHVFGVATFPFIMRAGLAGKERQETFFTQFIQNRDGWYVGVTVAARIMFVL